MSKKLFIGGISWNTDETLLRDAFSRFGEIEEASVITDRETGRSRGFAFVTFANGNAAEEAVRELDGQELDGRCIRVNEAQERSRDGGGAGRRF